MKYTVDRLTGLLTSLDKNGTELLREPLNISVYRPWRYNTRGVDETWNRARYDRLRHKCYTTSIKTDENGNAVVEAAVSLAAAAMPPAMHIKLTYTIRKDGSLTVCSDVKVTHNAPALPQFGFEWKLPAGFENAEYYGYGPHESYAERWQSTQAGLYESTVTDLYEPYIAPQESCARLGTKYAALTNENGNRVRFYANAVNGFSFKALHYTNEILRNTKHHDELVALDETVVSTLYRIGYPSVQVDEKEFSFAVTVLPY